MTINENSRVFDALTGEEIESVLDANEAEGWYTTYRHDEAGDLVYVPLLEGANGFGVIYETHFRPVYIEQTAAQQEVVKTLKMFFRSFRRYEVVKAAETSATNQPEPTPIR